MIETGKAIAKTMTDDWRVRMRCLMNGRRATFPVGEDIQFDCRLIGRPRLENHAKQKIGTDGLNRRGIRRIHRLGGKHADVATVVHMAEQGIGGNGKDWCREGMRKGKRHKESTGNNWYRLVVVTAAHRRQSVAK